MTKTKTPHPPKTIRTQKSFHSVKASPPLSLLLLAAGRTESNEVVCSVVAIQVIQEEQEAEERAAYPEELESRAGFSGKFMICPM